MDKALPRDNAAAFARDERALVQRALNTLHQIGVETDIQAKPTAIGDFTAVLRRGGKRTVFIAEVKRTVRPATLGPILMRMRNHKPPALLLTEYITPAMGKTLRDQGIAFADTAGNAHLKLGGDLLYIVGNTPEQKPREEKPIRAFQPTGLRVIFALLCKPDLALLPTREIALQLGVANGTVGQVIDDLTRLDFMVRRNPRVRRLRNLAALLERWTMMYAAHLRPTLLRGRFTAGTTTDWWKEEQFDGTELALGAEPAAHQLTQYLKPGVITIYARQAPRALNMLIARRQLRRDPTGNIEVLDAFWPANLPVDQPGLVPTPLIYADLLATGDARGLETAKLIYEKHLAGRFQEA